MRLLLDTHVVLWWFEGDSRLSTMHHALLSDVTNQPHVSSVSLAEIAIKSALGKLRADVTEIESAARHQGFMSLPFIAAHALGLAELPLLHRDPFDRMLVAQAQHEGFTLLTGDPAIARYDVETQ